MVDQEAPVGPETRVGDNFAEPPVVKLPSWLEEFVPQAYNLPVDVIPRLNPPPAEIATHEVDAGPETNTGELIWVVEFTPTSPDPLRPQP